MYFAYKCSSFIFFQSDGIILKKYIASKFDLILGGHIMYFWVVMKMLITPLFTNKCLRLNMNFNNNVLVSYFFISEITSSKINSTCGFYVFISLLISAIFS